MTVYEIYDNTVKRLSAEERLRLAKLILNDLSPDEKLMTDFPERPSEIRNQKHLEKLLLAGLHSGPDIATTAQYWENKRTTLLEHHAQKLQKA